MKERVFLRKEGREWNYPWTFNSSCSEKCCPICPMLLHCVFLNYLAFRIITAHKCSIERWLFSPLRAIWHLGFTSDNPPLSLEYTALFLFLSFTCLCKCTRMYLLSVHCNQIQFNSTQAKRLLNRPPCLHSLHNRVFFVSASSLSFLSSLTLAHG